MMAHVENRRSGAALRQFEGSRVLDMRNAVESRTVTGLQVRISHGQIQAHVMYLNILYRKNEMALKFLLISGPPCSQNTYVKSYSRCLTACRHLPIMKTCYYLKS